MDSEPTALIRTCPDCGGRIVYQTRAGHRAAERRGSRCSDCGAKKQGKAKTLPPMVIQRVLELNGQGWLNSEIAGEMGLSCTTVRHYLREHGVTSPQQNYVRELVGDDSARCSRCKLVKPLSEFTGRYSYCKTCVQASQTQWVASTTERYLTNRCKALKSKAARCGIPFDLTPAHLLELYERQGGCCVYTEKPLVLERGKGHQKDSLSVDRIQPTAGYVIGNVALCTAQANVIKSNVTLEELEQWMPSWHANLQVFLKTADFARVILSRL